MSEHEFMGEQPAIALEQGLAPGVCPPEAGRWACAGCAETVAATLITLEKDEKLPICNTCGPMTRWVKPD